MNELDEQFCDDMAREQRIQRFGESMLAATRASDAVMFWEMRREEINRRSRAQLARIEEQRGVTSE